MLEEVHFQVAFENVEAASVHRDCPRRMIGVKGLFKSPG